MNQEQQVDLAQTLMRELMCIHKFQESTEPVKLIHKLQQFNPFKLTGFNKNGQLILIAINFLIHCLKHKQIISPSIFKKYFTLSAKNLQEGRLINFLTHGFSHISLPHLISNILLFFWSSQKVSMNIGAKRMIIIYIFGAIVSGLTLYLKQRQSKDNQQVNGSNGGYSALAGYTSMMLQNQQFKVFGINLPIWLKSLISILSCIQIQNTESKNIGYQEFSGFLTGILLYITQNQILPQQQKQIIKQDFQINFM